MNNNYQILINKLDSFIRKYYRNQLLKGGLYTIALLLLSFIFFTSIEYFGQFNVVIRTTLFYAFWVIVLYVLTQFIFLPISKLYKLGKVINHPQAAEIIGNHFDEVKDKLINVLQLQHQETISDNELLLASIDQKSVELKTIPFSNAINLGENKKYLKYVLIPILLLIVLSFVSPNIFTEGTSRLVNHAVYIEPKAPFSFQINNEELEVLKNKDFVLEVDISGNQVPHKVYVQKGDNKYLLSKTNTRTFTYTFKNVQKDQDFQLYASGFYSKDYELEVIPNPILIGFSVKVNYPSYLKKEGEEFQNSGDLILPEGAKIDWSILTENVEHINFSIDDTVHLLEPSGRDKVSFSTRAFHSQKYFFAPANSYVEGGDTVHYSIQVIPDQFPTIEVDEKKDSINAKRIYFRGKIKDDYGFTNLTFNARILNKIDSLPERNGLKTQVIPFNKSLNQDEFFHFWNLEELNILPGDEVEYYFTVWDNDGVNGRKSAKTSMKVFKAKTKKELDLSASKNNLAIKDDLKESIKQAKDLQKELEELRKKLGEKKQIGWEEKEKIKELLDKQRELEKKLKNIQNENKQNNIQQNEYKEFDQEILDKQERLEELFEELMTEEMKEMMNQIQEMMEKLDKNLLENELEKMDLSNKDLEKELDRSLELFKQLEFEQKLDDVKNKLDELADEQKDLSEKTKNKALGKEELKEKQEKLNKKFEELSEELNELEKMDEELERPNGVENSDEQKKEIAEEMNKSSDQIEEQKNKKAAESQKKAAEKMEELSDKLSALQSASSDPGEDMDALRELLDNLLYLSFEQEELMNAYGKIDRKSPEYTQITQRQKELKDDAKMIEDSLFALSKRVVQLETTINKEIAAINNNMDKTVVLMADRNVPMALSRQQYVMTSINNLALLFDEALQQMQKQAKEQKQGKGSCDKPGSGGGKPKPSLANMKKMQEQLNKQLEELKKALEQGKKPGQKPGQKPGEGKGFGMSKSLAKMAAEQAKIRQQIQKMRDQAKTGKGRSGLDGLSKLMEQTETDLVNKRITRETINRQKEILTRLLESEKADKEREWDDKRESKEGQQKQNENAELFFEFNKGKEKEVDLLKTTPTNLNSFYKKKVTQYFQNINQ